MVAEQQVVEALLEIGTRTLGQRREVFGLVEEWRQHVDLEGQVAGTLHAPGLLDHGGHGAVGELRVQRHQGHPAHTSLLQALQDGVDGRLAIAHRQLHRAALPLFGDLLLQAAAEHHQR
ncbi:hypothetical protein D3C72_2011900 [compost metagenome]